MLIIKNIAAFALLLSVLISQAQKSEVVSRDGNKLAIRWDGKERLLNGIALLQKSEAIIVRYKILNDVTLLGVSLNNKTVPASGFAGIFFDDVPECRC